MDLIIFLSNIGGLISMYFGLGVYDMASAILNYFGQVKRKLSLIIYNNKEY